MNLLRTSPYRQDSPAANEGLGVIVATRMEIPMDDWLKRHSNQVPAVVGSAPSTLGLLCLAQARVCATVHPKGVSHASIRPRFQAAEDAIG